MSKRKRRKFSDEFKEEAVKLITQQGYSIAEAARNLGINANQLGRWKKEIEGPAEGSGEAGVMAAMQAELKRLRKENKQLKMEREILRKVATFFGVSYLAYLQKNRDQVLLHRYLEEGFYSFPAVQNDEGESKWILLLVFSGQIPVEIECHRLIPKVKEIHRKVRGAYGARRMAKELTAEGEPCGRTKAATLMQLAAVSARHKKKYKVTTESKHKLPVAPILLNRNFAVTRADCVYCSDITYVWTREGWLYLAVVWDLYSRKVVGWSMSKRITRDLVTNALKMAIWRTISLHGPSMTQCKIQ